MEHSIVHSVIYSYQLLCIKGKQTLQKPDSCGRSALHFTGRPNDKHSEHIYCNIFEMFTLTLKNMINKCVMENQPSTTTNFISETFKTSATKYSSWTHKSKLN